MQNISIKKPTEMYHPQLTVVQHQGKQKGRLHVGKMLFAVSRNT